MGGIFGAFVGALVAIPVAGALQVIVREWWLVTAPEPAEPAEPGGPAGPAGSGPPGPGPPAAGGQDNFAPAAGDIPREQPDRLDLPD